MPKNADIPVRAVPQNNNPSADSDVFPVIGTKVQYIAKDDATNEWCTALAIRRGGKKCGRNRYWLKSMDFGTLKVWQKSPDEVLITASSDCNGVAQAKQREIDNLKSHNVFTKVCNAGQPFINVTS